MFDSTLVLLTSAIVFAILVFFSWWNKAYAKKFLNSGQRAQARVIRNLYPLSPFSALKYEFVDNAVRVISKTYRVAPTSPTSIKNLQAGDVFVVVYRAENHSQNHPESCLQEAVTNIFIPLTHC
jgi:hypothetical protein